jgi:hypothetical protein
LTLCWQGEESMAEVQSRKVHSSGRLSFLAIVPKIVLVLELVLVLVSFLLERADRRILRTAPRMQKLEPTPTG